MDYTGATKQYDISYGQVYAWVKKFKQGGPEALVDRRGKAKSDDGHLSEANGYMARKLALLPGEVCFIRSRQEKHGKFHRNKLGSDV
ncbi:helix-turn-helix domain-containing protein [Agrilactobacillus fermenti]|uniref:helix-turn-helix domain-containing protein n=1 Tax=Agrilactobacillus fermenti TaxID=2586909 RepID=UPI001E4FE1A6|nr:helix-turn-helix domain-containing protein [Agrilactobacillus fermenti]